MKKPSITIPYVAWRNGRPRFEPSPTLRTRGYQGEDLKNAAGEWMNAADALEWSQDFARQLAVEKHKIKTKPKRTALPVPPPVRPAFPVSTLFDEWSNLGKNPGWADISEKTQYEYRHKGKVIEKYLPDVWQSETAALTKPICLGMYDILRQQAGLSQASATMRTLGTALTWAMDRGRLPEMLVNPAHKLRMKTPPPRIRFGTKEEIAQMVAVADAIGRSEIGDMIILGVWSGQRQNDRLNFQIAGREKGRIVLRQMKTKAIVSMPEAPLLRARIEASEKRRKLAEVISPYVVLDEKHWTPFKRHHYSHQFGNLRDAAAKGLPETATRKTIAPMPSLKTLRDQDLRDTAVTWLAMAGCTIPEICAITGHEIKSAYDILKHYLALNPEMADSAMAKLVIWFDADDGA
ncbi:hypothetical protein [Rhizobium sp. PL01]|uniref:hypothetical protein n=1 Tax=Rhizobium sp. PL01 TaxID=3085631 RepID=UPI0029820C6A|nr:hypothetical protein [Rhizobium sp. PL01]MDW5313762.1 hypothetical protein [Rhizobium sp. PL01]